MSKIYRIVPLGITGSGKSQLCNFIYKDKSNTKFEVSDSLNSKTKNPQFELCTRNGINIELVDTAGCSDSNGDDEKNFKKLIEKLREKKTIDLFLLVFNFTGRIDETTRDYIKLISNTFTPTEFYNHLAVIITNYRENPTKKEKIMLDRKVGEIKDLLKEIIGIGDGENTVTPKVYELGTETDDNDEFIKKFQETIDVILLNMKANVMEFGEVNTETIKYNGKKDRLKEEEERLKQIEINNKLKQQKYEEKMKKLEEERRKEEIRIQEILRYEHERVERLRREYENRQIEYESARTRSKCTIF